MCDTKQNEKKFTLAEFFGAHWDKYLESPKHTVLPEQFKAVNAILTCRTAVLGVKVYACPDCGEVSEVYHSCKNRFCPTCSWKDTMEWAEKVKDRMLNIKHRHVVFTIPHSLHPLVKRNRKLLLGALMRSAAGTFTDWFKNKHNLKIGVIDVLHTFSEKKEYHAHVHMIVSWGGVHTKTGELVEIEDEYVNYDFLKKKFRQKFGDELVAFYDKGMLDHGFTDRSQLKGFLKKANQKKWILHLEPSMETPEEVIRYIGRYSKRACLSEYKITSIEGDFISFRYKDNRDKDENNKPKEKIERLHYSDFFPRLLQHVPPAYFRVVRYYGLYSNHGNIPEEYFYKKQEATAEDPPKDPLYCETCNTEKILVYIYFDTRTRKQRKQETNKLMKIKWKEVA